LNAVLFEVQKANAVMGLESTSGALSTRRLLWHFRHFEWQPGNG